MNASNNDYWVGESRGRFLANFLGMVFGFPPQGAARHETRLQKQTNTIKKAMEKQLRSPRSTYKERGWGVV